MCAVPLQVTVKMSSINLLVAGILLNLYVIIARNESKYFSLNSNLLQITPRIKRQIEVDCFLPNHPTKGELKILEDSEQSYSPNSRVIERTIIDLSCAGYSTKTGGLARAICYRGVWIPAISKLGGCIRTPTTVITPTERGCIFPPHPPNGEFTVPIQKYLPNSTSHEFANVRLNCTNGYVPESDNPLAFCSAGHWMPDLSSIGGCIRGLHNYGTISSPMDEFIRQVVPSEIIVDTMVSKENTWQIKLSEGTCSSIKANTDSYTVKCIYNNYEVPCESPKEGTRADVHCKTYFEYTASRPIIECKDGSWNHDISPCTPECGRKRRAYPVSELGGGYALPDEFPWLAGIYSRSDGKFLCRGSIISRYYVLSAAHCFVTTREDRVAESDYLIAAGKYWQYLDDPRDFEKQVVKISRIYIPEDYLGIDQNYAFDYAVIQLEKPFVLSKGVQLVCVDWDNEYERIVFSENNRGIAVGWGFPGLGIPIADKLKKITVLLRNRSTCEEFLPKDFVTKYYTFDKFCAGVIDNKTNVCDISRGGGLYFRDYDYRFYVRGIVSVTPSGARSCDSNRFALYTKVSKHLDEIGKITKREM